MLKLSSRGKKLFECVIASSPHLGGFGLPRVHYQRTGPYNFNLQMIGSRALRADFTQEKRARLFIHFVDTSVSTDLLDCLAKIMKNHDYPFPAIRQIHLSGFPLLDDSSDSGLNRAVK